MRKVRKSFNFGSKGSIRIRLNRESYAAGDLVHGQLILRIARPIEREDFSLHIEGAETIAWSEGANHALSNCNMSNEFLCERIRLMEPMPYTFDTGEYRFRFRYLLKDTLPPVLQVSEGFAGTMREVNASVSYTITARLGVQGKLVADMETTHDLIVHRPSLCHPVRSLQRSSTDEVRLLSLMKSKGACEVSVCLDSDVHISGSTLSLQARISNYSSRDMHNLSVLLFEDLTVELPNRRPSTGTRVVCTQTFPGVAAGQLLDEMLYLPLINDVTGRPVAATNSSAFVRWQYRLEVKCRFTLSKSVKVEMPVVILRDIGAPPMPMVGATASPAMIVVVPEEDGDELNSSQADAESESDQILARPIFTLPQAVAAV
ncbi:Arrestin domain-containing protein A [Phytophthora citrophthora]|uniref:Arrestin domain-containing protein A n=1 Tax=Phytophthora citrophthora TaxID=4793 RepID=A0AAD9LCA5_9STRA|nr:Arrestin domain-containing protein A [Phytophthora citrophthora]